MLNNKRTAFRRIGHTGKHHWNCNAQSILSHNYDPATPLQPHYFKGMLQNSLTRMRLPHSARKILRLLNFNNKKQKNTLRADRQVFSCPFSASFITATWQQSDYIPQQESNLYSNHTETIIKYFVTNLNNHKTQNRSGHLVY